MSVFSWRIHDLFDVSQGGQEKWTDVGNRGFSRHHMSRLCEMYSERRQIFVDRHGHLIRCHVFRNKAIITIGT